LENSIVAATTGTTNSSTTTTTTNSRQLVLKFKPANYKVASNQVLRLYESNPRVIPNPNGPLRAFSSATAIRLFQLSPGIFPLLFLSLGTDDTCLLGSTDRSLFFLEGVLFGLPLGHGDRALFRIGAHGWRLRFQAPAAGLDRPGRILAHEFLDWSRLMTSNAGLFAIGPGA
jgi:hypothetical protein